jgi:BirA family biotin operon repressor/biotin-[acetyl-CoA-carboxylase] ligase
MTLSAKSIETALAPREVRFYERTDSTNGVAVQWLRENAPAGSVVVADQQLKGRGRLGRTWLTPPGVALAVSVILRPRIKDLALISLLGAVAIAELCDHAGAANVGIKWPNDVQIEGRKVSGVLPEAVWNGSQFVGVVLGMGVNVRVEFRGTGLENTAISLESAVKAPLGRLDLLVYLLARADYWAVRLDSPMLFEAWKQRLTTLGQRVSINGISGTAEAVDRQGALLIRSDDGALHRMIAGDIALDA